MITPLIVAATAFLTFLPALQADFVNWDDPKNFSNNPYFQADGGSYLRWAFTRNHMGHYIPVTWLSLYLDRLLWGMDPRGYHLTNLILHCTNTVLLYLLTLRLLALRNEECGDIGIAGNRSEATLARRPGFPGAFEERSRPPCESSSMGVGGSEATKEATRKSEAEHPEPRAGSRRGMNNYARAAAALAALLFALHPLRVESVAWVTERRDLLSGSFYLLTVLFFASAARGRTPFEGRWIVLSLGCFSLALLSKATGLLLPVVLIFIDRHVNRETGEPPRLGKHLPYFIVSCLFLCVVLHAQSEGDTLQTLPGFRPAQKIVQGGYGLTFYLWKTLFPLHLSPLYPHPPWIGISPLILAVCATGGLLATLWMGLTRGRHPGTSLAWCAYCCLLVPVLGVAQASPWYVADRFGYLSCAAWPILAVGWDGGRRPRLYQGGLLLVAAGWGILSWEQSHAWKDSGLLWSQALRVHPRSYMAHNNLGNHLTQESPPEAIRTLQRSLRIQPANFEAHHNLGIALALQERHLEAVRHFRTGLEHRPDHAVTWDLLGISLERIGEPEEALSCHRRAVALDPRSWRAHNNLGVALARRGLREEAHRHFQQALTLNPGNSEVRKNLSRFLLHPLHEQPSSGRAP
jgi:Flp pilus assembly protein TadD